MDRSVALLSHLLGMLLLHTVATHESKVLPALQFDFIPASLDSRVL